MTTSTDAVTVRMPAVYRWILALGATALGVALGFLVKPITTWLVDLVGSAPGPLRLAANLPPIWAVLVLTVVGAVAGLWLAHQAQVESLEVTVRPEDVRLAQNGAVRHVARAAIGEVFLDRRDLVLLDRRTGELARNKASDLDRDEIATAFERLGYPWRGGADPHEHEFRQWADGAPDLPEEAHALLRARARARTDKQAGRVAELTDELRDAGVVVRDRDGAQQYRPMPER
ncbi:hypothetical protein SAMN05421810_103263 [Amycolatopsis arida]|uniref:DUF308 domain-containing protein n=1 Tax=Amycolatopsis arida TaxID=587909 RepID=A0A1I5ST74_9PSEU|nr:hypothetical protein [Amycolatopsis arida]TDX96358.1 hypothetical protein CLV69_103495 [Amycolatopsis arida]SFP73970.1 hypothetical protein SAMN05421810_103263 [Amycolatopsis arida]